MPEKIWNVENDRPLQLLELPLLTVLWSSPSVGTTSDRKGIMFLTEVALGNEEHITRDDSSLTAPPSGKDSIIAKGWTEPGENLSTIIARLLCIFNYPSQIGDISIPVCNTRYWSLIGFLQIILRRFANFGRSDFRCPIFGTWKLRPKGNVVLGGAANVARTCPARRARQGMLLLDPSVIL
jgi:hypothetical protein